MEEGKVLDENRIIRIENYGKIREVHEKITKILNSSGVSCYNALIFEKRQTILT